MDVAMHAAGLWSWSVDDASSLYHEAPEGIVLADPLVPQDEAERFWRALDRDVERIGRPPTIVVSAPTTSRSAAAVRARYPGAAIIAPEGVATDLRDAPLADAKLLPGGVAAHTVPGGAFLTCPCHGLLWTGSLLTGDGHGGLVSGPVLTALSPSERAVVAERLTLTAPAIAIPASGTAVTSDAPAAIALALG